MNVSQEIKLQKYTRQIVMYTILVKEYPWLAAL